MKKLFICALATAALGATSMVQAKPASTLRDLIGARGSSGEAELQARGFRQAKGGGAGVTYWGNASDGTCVKVTTREGRYAAIVDMSPNVCGVRRPATGGGGKAPIGDLVGKSGVSVFDIMQGRGFAGVDTMNSGNDLISIYWNARTRQCVQVISSNSKVVAASDIGTHPKCR